MTIPESYLQKYTELPNYLAAIQQAQAPERFSQRFLEQLGFTSKNDRLVIGVLKGIGFLDQDGKPTDLYFQFLDKSSGSKVLALAIRDAYDGLFSINKNAQTLSDGEVEGKFKTILKGSKSDAVVKRMARTFTALCAEADFLSSHDDKAPNINQSDQDTGAKDEGVEEGEKSYARSSPSKAGRMNVSGLQYHINIVLPVSTEQSVYDAIFRSLREHLG